MANTVSAIRAVKKIKKRTQVNKIRVGKYKAAVKTIEEAIKSKDKAKAIKQPHPINIFPKKSSKLTDAVNI